MEWNSRFLIFAIYGNAKDEWNSAESKRSMAEDARETKKMIAVIAAGTIILAAAGLLVLNIGTKKDTVPCLQE